MSYLTKTLVAILFLSALTFACFNPADQWAAGIIWNDCESVDFMYIDSMGKKDINYFFFRESIAEPKIYESMKWTFRSHYDSAHAMVYLGYFVLYSNAGKSNSSEYGNYDVFPRMAVILDSTQDANLFDFSKAIETELQWLVYYGILRMSSEAIQKAVDSLKTHHGNAQYWTHQSNVLSYNSWYDKDTQTGIWSVNGVKTLRSGCGLDVAFDVPSGTLATENKSLMELKKGLAFLEQNNPNPFNPRTTLRFFLPKAEQVTLKIYDSKGVLYATLADSRLACGMHQVTWDAGNMASGVYICMLQAGTTVQAKRIITLLK